MKIRRRVYKNLYRNGRRRAAHTNSAEQREGDLANEELPADFSAATALKDLPVTLQFPSGTFDKQFERREDEQNAARIMTIEHAVPKETEERCEIQVPEEAKSVYSGYVPTALLRRPTPSVAGELPNLKALVKGKFPPLNEYLLKKSGRYYKKGVLKEKVAVPLAPVVVPPPEVPLNRLKRSPIPPNPGFKRAAPPTYPQHRAKQRFRKRFHQQHQDKEKYEKEVRRRQIEKNVVLVKIGITDRTEEKSSVVRLNVSVDIGQSWTSAQPSRTKS